MPSTTREYRSLVRRVYAYNVSRSTRTFDLLVQPLNVLRLTPYSTVESQERRGNCIEEKKNKALGIWDKRNHQGVVVKMKFILGESSAEGFLFIKAKRKKSIYDKSKSDTYTGNTFTKVQSNSYGSY